MREEEHTGKATGRVLTEMRCKWDEVKMVSKKGTAELKTTWEVADKRTETSSVFF